MAIDFGLKNVGFAFSDVERVIASPHSIYKRRNIRQDLGYINFLFRERDCAAIIMGFPEGVKHDIRDKIWMEKIIAFAHRLTNRYNINVYLQDESCSTQEAMSMLKYLPKKKIKNKDDKIAASCILQRTLDIMVKLNAG